MSKVRKYPIADPTPAAIRSAERAMMPSFLGERQKGVFAGGPAEDPVGGVPPGLDGVPPEGGPTTGGRPAADPPVRGEPNLVGPSEAEFQALRSSVLKGSLAAEGAA